MKLLTTILFVALGVTCTTAQKLPLKHLVDLRLSGGSTRLDYQSFDAAGGRLYIAPPGCDLMTVFDILQLWLICLAFAY